MIYVFFRDDGFYPIDVPDNLIQEHGENKCILDNVSLNPGTRRVESMDGRIVYEETKQ